MQSKMNSVIEQIRKQVKYEVSKKAAQARKQVSMSFFKHVFQGIVS